MVKAIKKTAILIILTSITFLILLGIFGKHGYMVNKQIAIENKELEENISYLEVKKTALENYEKSLTSSDALDDIALKLGYNKSGEEVYFFPEKASSTVIAKTDSELLAKDTNPPFKGLNTHILLLISFAIIFIPYLIIVLIQLTVRHGNRVNNIDERKGGYDDYDI